MTHRSAQATVRLDEQGRIVSLDAAAEKLFGASEAELQGKSLQQVTAARGSHDLSEELFFVQTLIDAIPSPVFYKDAAGIYLGCNRAFEGYIGLARKELVGKSVFEISPRELAERYFEADEKLLACGPGVVQQYEAGVRYADGTHHDVIFFKATFANRRGELGGIIGTMLDITDRKIAEGKLAEAMADSERLLRSVLPETIANRLKQSPGVIADSFAEASVLFADVVGFTSLAERMSAPALVGILNEVFSAFDAIVAERGAEKIKTIGDAYMVVAGVPEPRSDHAEVIAEVALAMRDRIGAISAEAGAKLELRLGLHTGPVVAGVIGTHKFLYDLWGDTVNTASRMESHGIPGEIHITEAMRAKLDPHYTFVDRGRVAIKGKGEMPTFLLRGRRQGA